MSSKLTSIEIDGKHYPNGGIPGLTFSTNKTKIRSQDLPEGQILQPIETNVTKVARDNAENGVWAYPGLDKYV